MIKNILKGFIIGVGKIVPGVSGSMLAISLGVYEKLLIIMANLKQMNMTNFRFLLTLTGGIFLGISLFSHGVKWLLSAFYFPTILLFIGLIVGGVPDIVKELKKGKRKKRYLAIFIVSLTFAYILTKVGTLENSLKGNIFIYFLLGLIEAFSSIVPGISGTAIFMSLGCYDMLLDFFSNIFNPNYLMFGLFFALGILTGIILLAKIITFLLKRYKCETYHAIMGFMVSSLFVMLQEAWTVSFTVGDIVLGLILAWVGYKITTKINYLLASDSD